MDLGVVSSIVGDQVVVSAVREPPKIGAKAYLGSVKVGLVADVIGSVKKPYLVLKCSKDAKIKVGDSVTSR